MRTSAERYTDFRTVASSENASILNQQGFDTVTDCRNGRTNSRHAAARNDEIEFFRIVLDFHPQQSPAKFGKFCGIVGRNLLPIRDIDRITAAVEAGQVVESELDITGIQRKCTGLLPAPCGVVCSENRRKGSTVDVEREPSGGLSASPDHCPVTGSYPERPVSGFRNSAYRNSIFDGNPHPVSHNVGRTHRKNRLCFDQPAAQLPETFGFNEKLFHTRASSCIRIRWKSIAQIKCSVQHSTATLITPSRFSSNRVYASSIIASG